MTDVTFDATVLVNTGNGGFHVSWPLLSADIQADIIANFGGALPSELLDMLPTYGAVRNAQIEKWLDQSYFARTTVVQGLNPLDVA